jgi:hypothetical protein
MLKEKKEIRYRASPALWTFHQDDSFVRGVMGPVGSGKSTACCWELFRRLQEQEPGPDGIRRTRWAVVRNTYRELTDTTVKTWLDWFDDVGDFVNQDMVHRIKFKDVEAEIMFRALDRPQDVKKLLSLELTGAWVNEAREVPRAVIDMLQGRVGRYPSKREGGPTWLGVIMDTNPPDSDHWWYRLFEEVAPDGWRLFKQPSGRGPDAENIDNLPAGYYDRLTTGKDDEWVRVYVDGEYGFISEGRPVYPEFRDHLHVSRETLKPLDNTPVVIGIDFGLTPAAVFGQRDVRGRWRWIHELVTEEMGAVRFAELLQNDMAGRFQGCEFQVWGDPAGEQRAQTDERTPFQILRARGLKARPAPTNDFTLRRESVAVPLSRLVDGEPGLLVSPACQMLRKAMGGGYAYKRIQVSGDERFHDKPDKNQYSHVAEAAQYLMLGAGEGRAILKHHTPGPTKPIQVDQGWSVFN